MGNPTAPSAAISNIFVLMLENHSFDQFFAKSGIDGIKVAQSNASNSYNGTAYPLYEPAPFSMPTDPGHEFPDVLQQLCGAKAAEQYLCKYTKGGADFTSCEGSEYPEIDNSGFAGSYATSTSEDTGRPPRCDIGDIMGCFDTKCQLPVINALAREFAICDHWFSSLPGPTWPNRFFVHGASSAGMDISPDFDEEFEWETYHGFEYANCSIYDALKKAGHGWRFYQDKDNAFSNEPSPWWQGGWISQVASLKGVSLLDIHSLAKFKEDLHEDGGDAYKRNYPYTFIEPNFGASFCSKQGSNKGPRYNGGSSQHPEDNPYGGEALIKYIYETLRASPLWESSLLLIMYDEHGGFYDSVKPEPAVCPGDAVPKGQEKLNKYCFDFKRLGVRVPAVVVSPFIPRGTVDHTVYDHSSVLATLERKLGMCPLTKRDEGANDVWHLLSEPELRHCPECLPPPAKIPGEPDTNREQKGCDEDRQLPVSGNLIGFLLVLLKAELEIAERSTSGTAAEIVEDFKKIVTHKHATEYVKKMMMLLDEAAGSSASNN